MNLLTRYRDFIASEDLFQKKDHLLIAVSGGLDSVVLCELTKQSGYDFSIAHCNFQLRGEESERDEKFVRQLATHYGVEIFLKKFDTQEYAAKNKRSIQLAARELRYAWFNEIINSHKLQTTNYKLVTAHHANDNIETVMMNFFKGTGLSGLRGMLPKQNNIIRPLLFATRQEIKQFAQQHQLQWVEDSSNADDHYTRNYFRHKVMPAIAEAYPQVESNLIANLQRFREIDLLYRQHIYQIIKKLVVVKGNELHIPILKLQKTTAAQTILFELMQPLGFTSKQPAEALSLISSETGRYIASATHRIFRNRNWLIIAPLSNMEAQHIIIGEKGAVEFALGKLIIESAEAQTINDDLNTAFLDASEITFPLLLRPWRQGDYFYPLGMHKKKKLARFFIDQKLSATQKENVWVLEMNKKILWVIGMRIDNRFRITDKTSSALRITIFQRPA